MYEEFHSNFISSINACDFENANTCLMNELGKLLIRNKKDYVDMLNESGIIAVESMSDVQLIDLFIENAPRNKKLLLGAALLVNMHNRKMGFDGEDEISDDGVKNSYAVMNSYFCGADYDEDDEAKSNFIPIGLIARGAKKLINNRQDRKADEAERAKQKMLEQARREREAIAAKKKKVRDNWIIGSSVVVGLGLIILVVVKSRK